ncbi:MAG: hypothetical protein IJO88_03070 [Oscillospiraceae bacterium]|nr:hypothetical protein [Oscillospiraceae bacterium]
MKKFIALMLALMLVLSLAACGAKNEPAEETTEEVTEEVTTETEDVEISEDGDIAIFDEDFSLDLPIMTPDGELIEVEDFIEMGEEADQEAPVETTATLMLLQDIWMQYADNEKFAVMGGNPEAGVMDAPGSYDLTYAENLGYQLVIPADQLAGITEASTMIHMMNANTFSCGAFTLAEGVDAAAFAQAVRDALQGNQWICGFPETMFIANVGGIVLVAFGVNDAMGPFVENLNEAYADIQIYFDEAIEG